MFDTTLRYLSLIILPHPSFDIPLSEPEFRIHGSKGDHDSSYISQNQISQLGPIDFSTPRSVLKANSSHERRRNTICCYPCHLADSFPANEDIPTWPANISFLSSDTSRHLFYENVPAPSTSSSVERPHDLPSSSSSRIGQPRITSFVFADTSDDRVSPKKVRNKRKNTSKWKQKRRSAPPAVSLGTGHFSLRDSGVSDITSTNELQSIQQPPHLTFFPKHQKLHATSISPYTSKHFEIDLSPIIEDTHTFADTLQGLKSVERKPVTSDMVDSSESSYGELIQKKTIDYLSADETFEGLEWENRDRRTPPLSSTRFELQDCAGLRGDRYWGDEFWETFEGSSLVPELTLTAPTPEMAMSAKFRSEGPKELSCNGGLDYQLADANTYQPSRLEYTTPLASISNAVGTGTDILFDDMLDAGLNSGGILQLPASATPAAHSEDHFGDNAPSPSGKSRNGFLGQLLWRKSSVWNRVSGILRKSWSTHDQEKATSSAPAGPLDGSHAVHESLNGWKRFSRILGNAMDLSRHSSAGDQVPFTEPVDPLSDFGGTRRHGLDIPSDSMDHVHERWYGSSSSGMATPAYINEDHAATHLDKPIDTRQNIVTSGNFFGADVMKSFDHEPRRHSFGLGLGTKISKRRWRTSAEDPRSSTDDERLRNRFGSR